MSTPKHVVPNALVGHPFSRQGAAGHDVLPSQLTRGPYEPLLSGIWQAAGRIADPDPRAELLALLPALMEAIPGSTASHLTAGLLHRMRLPPRTRSPWPVHLTGPSEVLRSRRAGLVGHRTKCRVAHADDSPGVATTLPLRTAVDIAGLMFARGLPLLTDDELVAVLDGMIRRHRTGFHRGEVPQCSREDVERGLSSMRGRRGAARLRRALERAEEGVDSALETRVRLALVAEGMEGWVTDLEVEAPSGDRFWPDLADRARRLSIQVEGIHHDADGQRMRDIRRQRITAAAGWTEIRVSAADLVKPQRGPSPLIATVRAARAAAGSPF